MPGSWPHLVARFFDVASAAPLRQTEIESLGRWLTPVERAMFLAQPESDQRHGFESGMQIAQTPENSQQLVRAALLHDIGKRHARLGIFGRVLASMLIRFGWLMPGRIRLYAQHGAIASEELAELGAEAMVVDFARHHHGERPASISPEDWRLLESADKARLRSDHVASRYAGRLRKLRQS